LTNSYDHQKRRREVYYSLLEFQRRFIEDPKFNKLYREWIRGGCQLRDRPTVDRIDCMKGYTMDNIQILTWEQNRYKQRSELAKIRARKVFQMRNGELINIFHSVSEAVRKTGVAQGNLSTVLHGKRKRANGFEWAYENKEAFIDSLSKS
jgi:hypothetical protein